MMPLLKTTPRSPSADSEALLAQPPLNANTSLSAHDASHSTEDSEALLAPHVSRLLGDVALATVPSARRSHGNPNHHDEEEAAVRFGAAAIGALLSVLSAAEAADLYQLLLARWRISLVRDAEVAACVRAPASSSLTKDREREGNSEGGDGMALCGTTEGAARLLEALVRGLLARKMAPAAMLRFDRSEEDDPLEIC